MLENSKRWVEKDSELGGTADIKFDNKTPDLP